MNTNKMPKGNVAPASIDIETVAVPVDWEYKEEKIIPDNGEAEQQIADELDGVVYFD